MMRKNIFRQNGLLLILFLLLGGMSTPAFGQAPQNCNAIYVSPNGGGILGSKSQPTSLPLALLIYQGDTTRKFIVMEEGNYSLSQRMDIPGPVTLDGGYRIVNGDWIKNSSAITTLSITPGLETALVGQVNVGHYIGIAANGKSRFSLKDLTINVLPAGAAGQTSNRGRSVYGIYLTGSNNYFFTRLHVLTGPGSDGADGDPGADGNDGDDGGNGGPGDNDGASCGKGGDGGAGGGGTAVASGPTSCGTSGVVNNAASWRRGGSGGSGGAGGADDGNGGNDVGGNGSVGGTGGGGVTGGFPGTGGTSGDPGNDGSDGLNGTDGSAIQGISYMPGNRPTNYSYGSFFVPGARADQGAHGEGGSGGGGGGGGGGQTCFFCDDGSGGGGAGGGGGGEGGEGGFGGFGGGGTFGIYTYQSTVGNFVRDCNLQPGSPGTGGDGGPGGQGGLGGLPGGISTSGCSEIGCGGGAGAGGKGAGGGRGRDGANGDSKGIHGVSLSGTTVPNPVTLTADQQGWCTNSEIVMTFTNGPLDLAGLPASFYPDLGPGQSSSVPTASPASVYFTATGNQDIRVQNTLYRGFITMVQNRPLPVINSLPANACLGTPISLGTPNSGIDYDWMVYTGSVGSPLQTWNVQNPGGFSPPATGTYYIRLRVKDECCGWSVPVYDSISVGNGPVMTLGPDTAFCGTSVLDPGPGFSSYLWSTGNTLQTQTVLFPGSYSVTVTDSVGCQATDTVQVNIYPGGLTAQAGGDRTVCAGEATVLGGGPAAFGGTPSYTYTWSGQGIVNPNLPNPNAIPTSNGSYILHVTDANGCQDADTVNLSVFPGVIVNAGADSLVCKCDVVTLGGSPTAGGGTPPFTYLWTPGSGLSNPAAANPTYTVCANSLFFLTVTDSNGCQQKDTLNLTMIDEPAAVFFSTALMGTVNFTDNSYGGPTSWNWTFGDGGTSSLQNPVHTYQNSGTYQVCLDIANACGSSSYCDSVNVLILDAAEPHAGNWEIYPNPTEGGFQVRWDLTHEQVREIRIVNLSGQLIRKASISGAASGKWELRESLPKGFYMVQLISSGGIIGTAKLVVL